MCYIKRAVRALACVGLVATLLCAASAHAVGGDDHVTIGRLDVPGSTASRQSGLRRLLWEIDKRTSVDVSPEAVVVGLQSEDRLRNFPLLWLPAAGPLGPLSDAEIERLRRHLQSGGTLVIDNLEGKPGPVADSIRALAKRLFPEQKLEAVAPDHVLNRSFYLINAPVGRVSYAANLEAVFFDARAVLIVSPNDVTGALGRDALGQWENPVEPGGERQRELATRVGLNLVLYVLCLDYKTDQVHVPFILRRRALP